MAERFQPKTVASFNRHQLEQIFLWGDRNGIFTYKSSGIPLDEASRLVVDGASVDEKGKLLDERGRERLSLAYKFLPILLSFGEPEKIKVVHVWLISETPPTLEFRWKQNGDYGERRASETRFWGIL